MKNRILCSYLMVLVIFVGVLVRIAQLTTDQKLIMVGTTQSKRALTVAMVRGTIYDRNQKPLVNAEHQYLAALIPTQEMLSRIKPAMDTENYRSFTERIHGLTPMVASLHSPVTTDRDLLLFQAPVRYEENLLCPHIIGHLDGAQQHGVYGIEKDYDQTLQNYSGAITIRYTVTGNEEYQSADSLSHTDTTQSADGGVILTIDRQIQELVETVGKEQIQKGAVVVLDPNNGDVLASSSFPTFDPSDITSVIERTDSPLVNRVTSLYDCGSVFKTVTVIAALDYGISTNQCYECCGEMMVGETLFRCHNRTGHQLQDMIQAYASSCNLYFIQLAQEIGAQRLLSTAKKLGLTEEIVLSDSIKTNTPTLPSIEELSSTAALANLSFGQGKLLVSPLHIARITAAIVGHGTLPTLSLVKGTVDAEGTVTEIQNRGGETVLSTAQTLLLQQMMEAVVSEGTGQLAQTQYYAAAGKTGTAETGQIGETGVPVTQSWFTGYYPADAPKYCITVMIEDVQNGAHNAAEVFSEIANKL